MKNNPLSTFIVIAVIFFGLGWFAHEYRGSFSFLKYFETKKTQESEEPNNSKDKDGVLCAQVVTPAINRQTKEIREFPTPCDVPEGWDLIQNDVPGMDLEVQ